MAHISNATFRRGGFEARGRNLRNVDGVDLLKNVPQLALELGALILRLARVFLLDEPAQATVREMVDRRVQHVSRNQQDQRAGEQSQGLRGVAVARPHPDHAPGNDEARESREDRGRCRYR